MHDLPGLGEAAKRIVPGRRGTALDRRSAIACQRRAEGAHRGTHAVLVDQQVAKFCLADLHRVLQHRWNTGSSSPGELEMTCSTSLVAVCCSSASVRSSVRWRSSLSRRVFSMAMTACAANVLKHRKLLVGQRPGHKPHDAEQADRLIAAHHGHDRDRAVAAGQEVLAPGDKFRRGIRHVGNIHDPAIKQGCAVHVIPREGGTGNCASPRFDASRIRRGDGRGVDRVPVPERDADEGARKELQPALHDGVEHRLGIGGRVADDVQDLGSRGLLLERFAQLTGKPRDIVSRPAGDKLRRRTAFSVNALWRRALTLPPVLSRRLIASP